MERTDGIHIFIISLMLAIGCGFFLWGTVIHNKVGNPLERKKADEYIVSTHIELTNELETELSKISAFRVNAGIRTKEANVQSDYASEAEIQQFTIAPYEMSEVASQKALPSLTVVDLSLIQKHAILDSGIDGRNVNERIWQSPVDSPFPLKKGDSYVSFPQKREPPAIDILFKTMTPEGEFRKGGTNAQPEQNGRIAGSSRRKKDKANTSKSKADGGSYSTSPKSGLRQRSDDEFVFEAEDAVSLTPYFEIGQDKYASNSKYISAPESGDATALNDVGEAEYHFEVKKAGVYKVFGRIIAPTAGSDSFYIRMDNGPLYTWDLLESPDWTWQVATQGVGSGDDLTFELEAGEHILSIGNREDGTMLDIFVIQRLSD